MLRQVSLLLHLPQNPAQRNFPPPSATGMQEADGIYWIQATTLFPTLYNYVSLMLPLISLNVHIRPDKLTKKLTCFREGKGSQLLIRQGHNLKKKKATCQVKICSGEI